MVEAVCVIEPGHGPFVEAGDLTAYQQVDLHDPARQGRRGGDDGEAFQLGRQAGATAEGQCEACAFRGPPDQRQLRDPRQRDRQRQRVADLQAKRLVDAHADRL